jgi:uncharacterized delta-60 repeat protein
MPKSLPWIAITVVFVLCTGAFAQPEFDATFGSAGKVNLGGSMIYSQKMVVQPDNRIVMVSSCSDINFGSLPFCTQRVNENGTLDSTFGTSGRVYTPVPQSFQPHGATGIALQTDGKLVMVGFAGILGGGQGQNLVIVRYNLNGSLDASFGSGGMVINGVIAGNHDRAKKVAIQPDGKIVVVGYSGNQQDANYQGFVARYLPDGTLDESFGTGGIVGITIVGHETWGESIAIQPDGKILAGGTMVTLPGTPTPTASLLLMRLNPDGSPDVTWDGDGVRSIPFGSAGSPDYGFQSLALQSGGRIVGLGLNKLYRFNTDGSLDTSFDGDGSRPALPAAFSQGIAYDFTISPGGRITVAGHSMTLSGLYEYFVARYRQDGSEDPTFSVDGYLSIDITSHNDGALSVATDPVGRTVVGGRSGSGPVLNPFEWSTTSAVRLVAPPAAVAVGISGRVTRSDGRPVINAVLTTQDGEGTIRTARSNPFGYYRFLNIPTGQTYTISVRSKSFVFTDRSVFVGDEIVGFDFVGTSINP